MDECCANSLTIIYTTAGGLLVPESIIRLVVSASALVWFIRYIYCRKLQLLNC